MPKPKNLSYTNGRAELALQVFTNNQFKSLQAAARSYNVPITTLRQHIVGIQQQYKSQALNGKLSTTEAESLLEWILSMDQRGMPP